VNEPGQRNGQKLDDIVQDADEYYNYLREKHVQQTRLDAIIVRVVARPQASSRRIGCMDSSRTTMENRLLV
jgi:hypothetical protein